MFAILATDAMDPFYQNVTSFPTLLFTLLLLLCIFYWLLAVIGVVDLDFIDIDLPDTDLDATDAGSSAGLLGGLLLRLGLNGVPLPIVITLLSLFGWFICYYIVHFFFAIIPGGFLKFLVGIPVFVGSLYAAALITGLTIRPLRPLFQAMDQQIEKRILGQVAVVRTSRVDKDFGEAVVEDGGAGLIVKVRAYKEETFSHGDRVVLLEHVKEENIYRVISEAEFSKSS